MSKEHYCLSSLKPLQNGPGYTPAASKRLAGGRRKFPHQLGLGPDDILRHRSKVIDRMSISGYQDKISLKLDRGKLKPVGSDGEYILKPIPGFGLPKFADEVPANEHLTMLIAEQVFGIETAVNACIYLKNNELAYITKRFDRRDGQKVGQEDFCQLTQKTEETHGKSYKYSGSYEGVGETLKSYCPAYSIEVEKLYNRVLFNYAFSNGDAHLKNFSLYQSKHGDYILTPAYDLLCSSLHLPNESRLALDLFKNDFETPSLKSYGFHTGECFSELAERYSLKPSRGKGLLEAYRSIQPEVEKLIERSFLSEPAKEDYYNRYRDRVQALALPKKAK